VAVALRQIGVEVAVYERTTTIREVGAGIALWPNALKALYRLGMLDAIRAICLAEQRGRIVTWRGDILQETPMTEIRRRFGAPVVVAHRADVQTALLQALDPATVHLNAACTGFSQDATGVTAHFADGREVRADLLVGADGLHSAVRAQLLGPQRPRYAGYTAWRGIATGEGLGDPGTGFETWGCGARFGLAHVDRTRVYWYGTINAPEGGTDAPEGRKAEVLRLFGTWHAPIRALIEATPESAILRNDIYDREPIRTWSRGRVTLLGDAAHPTTPNLAQGACQALEDAVVLAQAVQNAPDVAAALRQYEARRVARTRMITLLSRRLGDIGQWSNPTACRVRDAVMKRIPLAAQLRQLELVVRYRL
jgi:2-polyprenyl-6-methoxyphenol hydroxylase-like FAD-dependent oxidoreductase